MDSDHGISKRNEFYSPDTYKCRDKQHKSLKNQIYFTQCTKSKYSSSKLDQLYNTVNSGNSSQWSRGTEDLFNTFKT